MACNRSKTRYRNKVEAEIALSGIHMSQAKHRRRKFRETPMRVYFCGGCKGWHFTSTA